jgi:CRP-like cAMP-binding protein
MGSPNCKKCDKISCAALNLNSNQLELQNSTCSENTINAGEVILSQGSLTSHIIYLRTGLVKEYQKSDVNQQEYIMNIIKEKTYLGLPSLFGDKFNHYSYMALTDVSVCYIDRQIFKRLLFENGQFGYKILESVSRDSLHTYHRFVNQNQKKIFGKLADALLYFSTHIYNSDSFYLHLSRNEVSYLIGTSRESVSKQLKQFEDEGIISMNGRIINILKPMDLERISKFG